MQPADAVVNGVQVSSSPKPIVQCECNSSGLAPIWALTAGSDVALRFGDSRPPGSLYTVHRYPWLARVGAPARVYASRGWDHREHHAKITVLRCPPCLTIRAQARCFICSFIGVGETRSGECRCARGLEGRAMNSGLASPRNDRKPVDMNCSGVRGVAADEANALPRIFPACTDGKRPCAWSDEIDRPVARLGRLPERWSSISHVDSQGAPDTLIAIAK